MTLDGSSTKSALSSLSVLGGLVALVPGLGQVAALAGFFPEISNSVQAIVGAFGALLAIYGRIRATKQIGSVI